MKSLSKYLRGVFLGAVLVGFMLLFSKPVAKAQSGSLYFSPSSLEANSGETFSIKIMINTAGTEVTAVACDFSYPQNLLEFVSLDSTNTVFEEVAEEKTDATGFIYITRFVSPGNTYEGTGEVITVNFKVLASGTATLSFLDSVAATDMETKDTIGSAQSATIELGAVTETRDTEEETSLIDTILEKVNEYLIFIVGAGAVVVLIVVVLIVSKGSKKEEVSSVSQGPSDQQPSDQGGIPPMGVTSS